MSDETNNDQSDAPDGAAPEGDAEVKTRSERTDLEQAQHRRQLAVKARIAAEAETERLRAELQALRAGVKPDGDAPAKPAAAPAEAATGWEKVMARLDVIEDSITGEKRTKARAAVIDGALEQMPEGKRAQARIMIAGLEASGVIDLSKDASADALTSAIHEHAPDLLRSESRGARIPPQIGADGVVNWDRYTSIKEVPKAMLKNMPDKHFERLTRGGGSGLPPMNI